MDNPAEKAASVPSLIIRNGNLATYGPDGLVIEFYNPSYRKLILDPAADSALIFETVYEVPPITILIPLTATLISHTIRGTPAPVPLQLSGIILRRVGNLVRFTMPGQTFSFTGSMDWIYFEQLLPVGWRPSYRADSTVMTRYDGATIAPAYWEIAAASENNGRVGLYWAGPYVAGPVSTFNDDLIMFEVDP